MVEPTLSKYEIVEKIGEGGMGMVYRAHDPRLQRIVAVKVLRPELAHNPDFVQRFLDEARRMARIGDHPHVVTVHDVGEENEWHYFAMQFLDGGDLAILLRQRGRLELPEAIRILQQITEALDYAHERGIIHRDIKPENLLLDQRGDAHVGDFGIARAAEEPGGTRVTKTGMIVGTPEYMSPEQAGSGHPVDHRTDLYSLGVVAYEMLCGRPPFRKERDTESPLTVIIKHVKDAPAPPAALNPALPEHVNRAILKALAKDPADRFATAKDFIRALTGEAPVAQPTVTVAWEPKERETGKKRKPLLAVAGILGLAIAGVILILAAVFRTVTVPDVVQVSRDEAQERLAQAHLRTAPPSLTYDEHVPAGQVIRQDPPGGTRVKPGSVVNLVVSRGPEVMRVPSVRQLPSEQARRELEERGLEMNIQGSEHSRDVPAGQVISQQPEPGKEVRKGTFIDVVLSLGSPPPPPVVTPGPVTSVGPFTIGQIVTVRTPKVGGVNLRTQPSDQSAKVRPTPLPDGTQLEILDGAGDWVKVRTEDGETGWVRWRYGSHRYLSEAPVSSLPSPSGSSSRGDWFVIAGSYPTEREAQRRAEEVRSKGFPDVTVDLSSNYSNFQPGYWIVCPGRFLSKQEARQLEKRVKASGLSAYSKRAYR